MNPISPNGIIEFHCCVKRDGSAWTHFMSCMEIINDILQNENVEHVDVEKWIRLSEEQRVGFDEKRLKPDILIDNKRAIEVENIPTGVKENYRDLLKRLGIDLTVVLNILVPKSMLDCTKIRVSSYSDRKNNESTWIHLVPENVIHVEATGKVAPRTFLSLSTADAAPDR